MYPSGYYILLMMGLLYTWINGNGLFFYSGKKWGFIDVKMFYDKIKFLFENGKKN